jgi:hypothetical protein
MHRRWPSLFCAASIVVAGACGHVHAQPAACERADFETVVDLAAETLRDLNQKNTTVFQGKLRQLKEKRGWSQEQFLKEGAPLVSDDKINAYNEQSEDLLARINGVGASGSQSAKPDCSVLAALRTNMQALVDAQTAKWQYMFGKVEAELGR